MTSRSPLPPSELTGALGLLVEAAASLLGPADASDAPCQVDNTVADQLELVLREAVQGPTLVPEWITSAQPDHGFGKYLLHDAPGFVVFSTVTAPGIAAPIHDHGSWGMVGLCRGAEEEVRYVLEPGTSPDLPGRLEELGRRSYVAGEVMVIQPPPDDIHQVFNRGSSHSVVLHLFLCDLVRSGFRMFHPPDHVPLFTGPLEYDPMPVERLEGER